MGFLEKFKERYEHDSIKLKIKNREFRFFVPADIEDFIDPENPISGFPLWAKIWEASIVLSDYISNLDPVPHRKILEVGCGLGMVGVIGAYFGHKIIMTDYNRYALEFAKANAIANLGDNSHLQILAMDWKNPGLKGRFDMIIGSEIIYKDSDFDPLRRIMKNYLNRDGQIVMACEYRCSVFDFLHNIKDEFHIKIHKKRLSSQKKELNLMICLLRPFL